MTPILTALGPLRLAMLGAYALFSVTSFVLYAHDKAAARRGAWRTPEVALHLVSLAGGWPGALLGQRVFHHKTCKQPFRTIFWGTVVLNCAAAGWLLVGLPAVSG